MKFNRADIIRSQIGLVGGIASGKTTISKMFERFGFTIISLSDFIKEEIKAKNLEMMSRDVYFDTANAMRRQNGNHIIAQMAINKIVQDDPPCFLIDGIRVVEEVTLLREAFTDFFLIGINTSLEERLRRIQLRQREIDAIQIEKILKDISRESSDGAQVCQLDLVLQMCDMHINGAMALEEIRDECYKIVTSKIYKPFPRKEYK